MSGKNETETNDKAQLSRREFLKDAGLVIGGATVGSMTLLGACGSTETVTQTTTIPTTTTVTQPPVTKLIEAAALATSLDLTVNGFTSTIQVSPNTTLAEALRERLNLTGTKIGCDRGTCGACVVLADGKPILSCMTLAAEVGSQKITTVEGLADGDKLHPLQQAVYDNSGYQCGFCTPGVLMETKALLDENPSPTVDEIKAALGGHICRCGSFYAFIESVKLAGAK